MLFRICLLTCLLGATHLASAQGNDGFQRRDGTMYLIRNGETRPMTRDARLPNGRLITRDGFVVARDGKRTELKDGQGCTLLGEPVAVRPQPDGRLLLATSAAPRAAAPAAPISYSEAVWRWLEGRGRGKGKGREKSKHKARGKHDDD
ncbi:hypothetical protein HNQ93_000839 [Hymenobacter luteus]|uniref:DUF6799 domain-containing protein n=2 Tax=Hymenobacter TaxID=89966 RepID=A0A7W9T018_9BACT|nr:MULTISPECIES: DUF6799 domain-containing protein [Hymenobacter]MBB4599681.1 hypothetical protein [Hymenobacter latericoloratus]MBB6058009.1 hypothetical protein [Hymenobacter luteus]